MKNVVVLISGQGRNLQALLEHTASGAIPARIAAVISNRADAAGLARARQAGVPVVVLPHGDYADRASFDAALMQAIDAYSPDAVVLAGFMRILGDAFIRRYKGRLLNIHPSLLPKYPGLKTHQRALDAGDAEHGATVHYVTEELDGGPAIVQGRFIVSPQDEASTLAERVMQEIELKIYPQALAWVIGGEVELRGDRVWFRGQPLTAPLGLNDLEYGFR